MCTLMASSPRNHSAVRVVLSSASMLALAWARATSRAVSTSWSSAAIAVIVVAAAFVPLPKPSATANSLLPAYTASCWLLRPPCSCRVADRIVHLWLVLVIVCSFAL